MLFGPERSLRAKHRSSLECWPPTPMLVHNKNLSSVITRNQNKFQGPFQHSRYIYSFKMSSNKRFCADHYLLLHTGTSFVHFPSMPHVVLIGPFRTKPSWQEYITTSPTFHECLKGVWITFLDTLRWRQDSSKKYVSLICIGAFRQMDKTPKNFSVEIRILFRNL